MAEALSFCSKSLFNHKEEVKQQNIYFHAFTNALDVSGYRTTLMSIQPPFILTNHNSGRHLYNRGWLGLIPLFGAFVGIGLITLGLIRYKDKKLVMIGCAALLFTIATYGSLFYFSAYSFTGRRGYAQIAQQQLNTLVKEVEFYKVQTGKYPDSLEQISTNPNLAVIYDPLSNLGTGAMKTFKYQRLGEQYTLSSVGIDMMYGTEDDLYPNIDTVNTGLLNAVAIPANSR